MNLRFCVYMIVLIPSVMCRVLHIKGNYDDDDDNGSDANSICLVNFIGSRDYTTVCLLVKVDKHKEVACEYECSK